MTKTGIPVRRVCRTNTPGSYGWTKQYWNLKSELVNSFRLVSSSYSILIVKLGKLIPLIFMLLSHWILIQICSMWIPAKSVRTVFIILPSPDPTPALTNLTPIYHSPSKKIQSDLSHHIVNYSVQVRWDYVIGCKVQLLAQSFVVTWNQMADRWLIAIT